MVSPEELIERAKDAPPREPREDRGPRRDGPRGPRAASAPGRATDEVEVGGMKPPATLTDGVVVLRELREDDRAVVLSTMSDELVHTWLNMPAVLARCRLQLAAPHRARRARKRRAHRLHGHRGRPRHRARRRDRLATRTATTTRSRTSPVQPGAARADDAGGRLLCDWLFSEGVGRIELRTHPENVPSQRLAERAGFRREGLERKSIWLHGGGTTRSCGRCSRTTRDDAALPARPHAGSDPDPARLGVAPPRGGAARRRARMPRRCWRSARGRSRSPSCSSTTRARASRRRGPSPSRRRRTPRSRRSGGRPSRRRFRAPSASPCSR